jgi:hypothetical protein
VVALHLPHLASDEIPEWLLGDDLSALETLAGLDACAASTGVAMVLLNNSVPMNSVVRFINPPHSFPNFGRIDRESLSPPRAGREGGFNNPEDKKFAWMMSREVTTGRFARCVGRSHCFATI